MVFNPKTISTLKILESIFITGGTGLVGSYLIRKFISEGKTVTALKRPDSHTQVLEDLNIKINWIEGNILDIPFLTDALQDVDTVIHAAALVSFHPKHKEEMYQTNIDGTTNLVNISLLQNVKRFCFVSSVASLGRGQQETIDETAKWQDNGYNSEYAKTKYAAEKEVWRGIAEGLNGVIVNPSLVLGAGDLERSSTKVFRYILDGKRFFPAGSVNFVDVRDVADAIFRVVYSEISEERFILSAGNVSYEKLFGKIAERFDKKKPDIPINKNMLNVLWRLEKVRSFVTGSVPLISRETALIADKNYIFDNSKIRNTLDFTFRTLDETLDWACAEIRNKMSEK